MGNGNTSNTDRNGFNGKFGCNNITSKKEGEQLDTRMGKNYQMKNGNKEKSPAMPIPSASNRGSGSRFNILNEDLDVMITEDESHTKSKGMEGKMQKKKMVLSEITNLGSKQSEKMSRVPLKTTKIINKKIDKPGCSVTFPSKPIEK